MRDLTLRNPALAVMVVTTSSTAEAFAGALNAGARGVLEYPFGLEDLDHRLSSCSSGTRPSATAWPTTRAGATAPAAAAG